MFWTTFICYCLLSGLCFHDSEGSLAPVSTAASLITNTSEMTYVAHQTSPRRKGLWLPSRQVPVSPPPRATSDAKSEDVEELHLHHDDPDAWVEVNEQSEDDETKTLRTEPSQRWACCEKGSHASSEDKTSGSMPGSWDEGASDEELPPYSEQGEQQPRPRPNRLPGWQEQLAHDLAAAQEDFARELSGAGEEARRDFASVREELTRDFSSLQSEVGQDFAGLKQELGSVLEEVRADFREVGNILRSLW